MGNGAKAGDTVVRARGLVRRYGAFAAVRGIDFSIVRGECFGFLGPNGAGKTSTIRMITCRIPPTAGELEVFGLDVRRHPARIKGRMGVVAQEDNLDQSLTVLENLEIYGQYFGLSRQEARRRAEQLLEFMELEAKARVLPRELSGGMRRRLTIARALINRPELVVLDEPTTGLDPQARVLVWDRLAALKDQQVTLLLTTHYMEEAARLCDRLAIMDEGQIKAVGAPDQLVLEHAGRRVLEVRRWEGELASALAQLGARRHHQVGMSYFLCADSEEEAQGYLAGLRTAGVRLVDYQLRDASLEDVFLELTGRGLEGGGESHA